MKKLIAVALLVASTCFAQNAAPGTAQAPAKAPADPSAQKARTLLDNMIKALGGQAYLSYSTMTQDGRTYSFYQGEPNSTGTLFWRFWQYPDKDRVELTKQRDVVYIHTGDKGYEVTYKGTASEEREQLDDYLRRRDHSMEMVTRSWLKDPATIVLYVGTGVANQQIVEKISIVNSKNDEVTIAIDPHTSLPVQKTFTFRDKDKYKVEDVEVYANYKPVQGIMTPHTYSRQRDGLMVNQRFFNTVQYNVPLQASMFEANTTYDPFMRSKPR